MNTPEIGSAMSHNFISVDNIHKYYGSSVALENIHLRLNEGDIVSLLGPSGCGKTTLLRIIAGLESPDIGEIYLKNQPITTLQPEVRNFGLMFQDLVLFPHLNVADNISFGLEMQGLSRQETAKRVNDLLSLVNLPELKQRKVHELSGGERQRVALARALAPNPTLLMLDEPMGALDSQLRETLYMQIRDILKSLKTTAIYVTHDRNEAFAVSDYSVIMNHGKIIQTGTPTEIYSNPNSSFVAGFMGFHNLVKVKLLADTRSTFSSPLGSITIPQKRNSLPTSAAEGILVIPNHGISIVNPDYEKNLIVEGLVERKIFQDGDYRIQIRVSDILLTTTIPVEATNLAKTNDGDRIRIAIDLNTALVVPDDGTVTSE